jgi:hypothetical protein
MEDVDQFLKEASTTAQTLEEFNEILAKKEDELNEKEIADLPGSYAPSVLLGDEILADPDTHAELAAHVGEETAEELMQHLRETLDVRTRTDRRNTETLWKLVTRTQRQIP